MTLRHKEHQGDTRMDGSPPWGSNLAPLCHSIYRNRAGSQIRTQRGHSEAVLWSLEPTVWEITMQRTKMRSCSKNRELLRESRRLNTSIKIRQRWPLDIPGRPSRTFPSEVEKLNESESVAEMYGEERARRALAKVLYSSIKTTGFQFPQSILVSRINIHLTQTFTRLSLPCGAFCRTVFFAVQTCLPALCTIWIYIS